MVFLGAAYKRDARRDLFESVPVRRPPRHCPREKQGTIVFVVFFGTAHERDAGSYLISRFFDAAYERGKNERRLARSCSSSGFSLASPRERHAGDLSCLSSYPASPTEELQEMRRRVFCLRLFLFVVLFGVTRGRDTGKYEDRFA